MIQAVADKDTQDNYNALLTRREKTLKINSELYGKASENGRRMLDQGRRPDQAHERVGGPGRQVCAAQLQQQGRAAVEVRGAGSGQGHRT